MRRAQMQYLSWTSCLWSKDAGMRAVLPHNLLHSWRLAGKEP
jgi:hypothetical protein